jgi:hypothetical protein
MFKSEAQTGFSSCEVFVRQQENFYHIPMHLLKAIALIESGRTTNPGKRIAWPWTINVNGKGYVFETKYEAIKAVKKFQRQGETSIDVGCMQINLRHHPTAFRDLESAFDPQLNVAYAAQFLNNLKRQFGNWRTAVAHYHSASPKFHQPYREKIHKQWGMLRNLSGNMTPIVHDIGYTANSVTSGALQPPVLNTTRFEQRKVQQPRVMQEDLSPAPILPPGKFFPVNGQAAKPEPYARLKYRKFYHALPQKRPGFFPVK